MTQPSSLAARYKLLNLIGAGGMGMVYRAHDRLTGETVALKRVGVRTEHLLFNSRGASNNARVALAREFQSLASLRHPNIIAVRDYGFVPEGQPYFTMDLLDGALPVVQAARDQAYENQILYLLQILRALAYLHRRGIVHRDLKPSNILVANGQVKVVDFGLSVSSGHGQGAAGTLAYLAPEALEDAGASPASDLYAVGVIAYEIFAGKHPFSPDAHRDFLDAVLTQEPDIAAINLEPQVAGVVSRLLAKNPTQRFGVAAEVIRALSEATRRPLPLETEATRESFLQAARLVGRGPEMGTLLAALEAASAGQGSAWLVGGESGVGKSRLLNELRTHALVQGVAVLRGQAVAEGGPPYHLWHEAARWLAVLAAPDDLEASSLKPLAPDIAALLARPVPDAPLLDPKADRLRLLNTFSSLVRRVALTRPVLILLDDLQWVGSNSLSLLASLHQVAQEAGLRLMIVGSYRDDDAPGLAASLPGAQLLALERLHPQAVAELSESMLGEIGRDPDILKLLTRESEGNAFFAVEVVRTLAEEAGGLDRVSDATLPVQVFSGGIQQIVDRRLRRVPASYQPLLELAAVAGRAIDPAVLTAVGASFELEKWLAACAEASVLEVQGDGWRFAHDKLREGALRAIAPERRRELHRAVATAIEATYPDAPTQAAALAHHWGAVGDGDREARYALWAGELAAARFANDEATAFLARALTLITEPAARGRALLALGGVQDLTGNWPEAEANFRQALAILAPADAPALAAQAQLKLGQLLARRSMFDEALEKLAEARATFARLNDSAGLSDADVQAARIYNDRGDNALALENGQRALEIAEALGDRQRASACLGVIGVVYFEMGEYRRALAFYERRKALAEAIGDRRALSATWNNIGNVYFMENDYARAVECYSRKIPIAAEIGDQHEIKVALGNMGAAYTDMGEFENGLLCITRQLQYAVEAGDRWSMLLAIGNIAQTYVTMDRHGELEAIWPTLLALSRALDIPWQTCQSLLTYALWCYDNLKDYAQAQGIAVEAVRLAEQVSRQDMLFLLKLLQARLDVALGHKTAAAAAEGLRHMISERSDKIEQAQAHFAIWELDPTQETHRRLAADSFRALYAEVGNYEFRKLVARLTGELLPLRPPLPAPPEFVTRNPPALAPLLAQAAALAQQ